MGVVIWARHGQNEANLSRTLSHRTYDRDLTDLGRRQAEALGEALADAFAGAGAGAAGRVVLLASSPLKRARQTAEIVAARLGLSVDPVLEDLRELNVGSLDGRADPQAWESYERVLAAWQHGDRMARFPDGENLDELCLRLRRAITEVDRLATDAASTGGAGGAGLIVAHAGNLRAALPALAGAPEPDADLPTGGYATLRVTPEPIPEPEPGAGGAGRAGGAGARIELLTWSTPR